MSHQEPPPGWGQPPPQPAGKRNTGRIVGFSCLGLIALFVVLVAAVLLIGGTSDPTPKPAPRTPSHPAGHSAAPERGTAGDVRITKCALDSTLDWADARLLIENRSSKTSDYSVQIEFVNAAGKRLGDAYASVDALASGQSAEVTAQGLDRITEPITCRIVDIDRWAS
ncbi:FxLYD domain-containing protein [Streptomyces sp. NPDC058662]|uniref:FxLYD domain-containing protein n=1 Tax=Streptomyces sp. NPDC058662 TaxID=3346583 RepID=UPI00364707DC